MSFKLNELYRFLGITKQAVSNGRKRQERFDIELSDLVHQVDLIREEHPGCGVEKMYYTLKPSYLGRDKFCEIFMGLGYRIKQIKNYIRTTVPVHLGYPNLVEGMVLTHPYQVLQSDITYFYLNNEHYYYIAFVTDVYTRQIMGYNVDDNMRTKSNVKAMKMALGQLKKDERILIHHSDRGGQYGSGRYTSLLRENGIGISMGLVAYDNAYAERVNGTIKNEYLKKWHIKSFKDLKSALKKAVKHYNEKRKHLAFKNIHSPLEFKKSLIHLKSKDRPVTIIYSDEKPSFLKVSDRYKSQSGKTPEKPNCPVEFNLVT